MSDELTKNDIKKHGKRFVAYMTLAAFGLLCLAIALFLIDNIIMSGGVIQYQYWGISLNELVLLLIPVAATAISSHIWWRIFMKNNINRKKATSGGMWSAAIAYPVSTLLVILALIISDPIDVMQHSVNDLAIGCLFIVSYTAIVFLMTAIITLPIGYYVGVKITPTTFEDKLVAYREERGRKHP